jgi:hypothetical protein
VGVHEISSGDDGAPLAIPRGGRIVHVERGVLPTQHAPGGDRAPVIQRHQIDLEVREQLGDHRNALDEMPIEQGNAQVTLRIASTGEGGLVPSATEQREHPGRWLEPRVLVRETAGKIAVRLRQAVKRHHQEQACEHHARAPCTERIDEPLGRSLYMGVLGASDLVSQHLDLCPGRLGE